MPQMCGSTRKPNVHFWIGIGIAAAQSHDRGFVVETLKHTVDHRPKIERDDVHLHAQVCQIVLNQSRDLHSLGI